MIPRLKEPRHRWEVIDVELGHVFYCDTEVMRDDSEALIKDMGHRVIVKEIK